MSDFPSPQDQEELSRSFREGHEAWERQEFWRKALMVVGFASLFGLAIWFAP
jgi:hypothetical protein